jgi:hypothetical protein
MYEMCCCAHLLVKKSAPGLLLLPAAVGGDSSASAWSLHSWATYADWEMPDSSRSTLQQDFGQHENA